MRRRFYELAAAGPAPIASEVLRRIAELYKIEDDIRGITHEERRAVRQAKSRPIIDSLAPWLTEATLAYQPEGQARRSNPLHDLTLGWVDPFHQCSGRIEIDSSTIERSIRPIALNRGKNALFREALTPGPNTGRPSPRSSKRPKLNDVEPLAYLADVITKIVNGHPNSQLDLDLCLGPSPTSQKPNPWPENTA